MLTLKIKQVYPEFNGLPIQSDQVFFVITEQSGFAPRKDYKASNGISIMSCLYPRFYKNEDIFPNDVFAIRGTYKREDDTCINVSKEDFNKIKAAIDEILTRENAPKFSKTVTFLYGGTRRYKINVTNEEIDWIGGQDCDAKDKYIGWFAKSNIKDLQVLEDSPQEKTTNLYNFYYSAKQADHYSKVNSRGGNFDPFSGTSWKHWVNRINGQPYTACSKVGVDHGCGWDDIKLITTDEFSKATHGPDYW